MRYLLHEGELQHQPVEALRLAELEQYERPQPLLTAYDQLLEGGARQEVNP